MLEDKAMIIIAVSKYNGAYDNLPGTITSARRLREWAEKTDEDCNYKVLYLADDDYPKIDVQFLKTEIENFVKKNYIDRLVIYFAGHGLVRSLGDQFWLLTDAADDAMEGINLEAFRRGLLKTNINQLCLIGDACRNVADDSLDFYGHPILTSLKGKINPDIELDKFLSTGIGDYAVHIKKTESQKIPYCLFSEVMLSALSGKVQEAIETEYHKFKPAVTNGKLANYLKKEVRKRAAVLNEKMQPDINPGITAPHNYYKKVRQPLPPVAASSQDLQLTAAIRMAIDDSHPKTDNEQLKVVQERHKQTLLGWKERMTLNFLEQYSDKPDKFFTFSNSRPSFVALPKNSTIRVEPKMDFYEIEVINSDDSPILIYQDERWLLIPNYPNVINVISDDLPGDILFIKNGDSLPHVINNNKLEDEIWDTYLSDFSNLIGSVPLRSADAQKLADRIRIGKEEYPHQAVTAGYLYEFSNDYKNIARTAHYMAQSEFGVPFDLALLCADKIWWSKENDKLVAFADLPAVKASPVNNNEESRPYYTRDEFEELKNVRLWGIAPIFDQGWSFMQTERHLEIPEKIRLISNNTTGRSAASLTRKGAEMFLKAFEYKVIKTNA